MIRWLHRIFFSSIVLDYEIRLASSELRTSLLENENSNLRSKLDSYFDDHRRVADWLCVTPHEACRPIYGTIEGWKPEELAPPAPPAPAPSTPSHVRPPAPSTLREAGEQQEQEFIRTHDLETRAEKAAREQAERRAAMREAQASDQSILVDAGAAAPSLN